MKIFIINFLFYVLLGVAIRAALIYAGYEWETTGKFTELTISIGLWTSFIFLILKTLTDDVQN